VDPAGGGWQRAADWPSGLDGRDSFISPKRRLIIGRPPSLISGSCSLVNAIMALAINGAVTVAEQIKRWV
jgi:hypothetical protein